MVVKENTEVTRLSARMLKLGIHYERAQQRVPRDFDALIEMERQAETLDAECQKLDVDGFFIFRRGRNRIRNLRGMESVYDW